MAQRITCECGDCKTCRKRLYMRAYMASHPEQYAKRREDAKRYREQNLEEVRAKDRARGFRGHPAKSKARRAVSHAIAMGRLAREACAVCGDLAAQAHHDDYAKPLEVRWLCRTHHGEIHRTRP